MTPITSFYFRNPWEPLGILGTYCSWKSNFILGTLGISMNPGNPMYRNCMTPVITWNPLKLLRILWVLWTILLVLNSVKNCVCKHNQSKMNMDEPSWTFMNYDRTKRYFSSENKRIYLFLLRKEHIDLKFLEKSMYRCYLRKDSLLAFLGDRSIYFNVTYISFSDHNEIIS